MSNVFNPRVTLKVAALAVLFALAGVAPSALAQDLAVSWNPRSGDVWVDTWLGDVNRYGHQYREPFIDELVRYHAAPRPLVVELLERRHWAPGDVYYACSLAAVIGRPCRYVVDAYEADRGQGWGVIAQRMGIKPGSPEFHRLKKGFVPTYDRWARPIDLDDDLRLAYPGRDKGAHGKASHGPGKSAGNSADKDNAHHSGGGKSGAKGSGHGKPEHGPKGQGNSGGGKSGKGGKKGGGKGH